MDADGFFFSSRLKRMIKSSAFNVYPAQVEAALLECPAAASACVIGVPDEAQGERVKAFVVTRGDRSLPELASELIARCRARLIKWSCPREVAFRTELPLTRVGKIDYSALLRAQNLGGAMRGNASARMSRPASIAFERAAGCGPAQGGINPKCVRAEPSDWSGTNSTE